jgi:hypothetical protein
MPIAVYKGQHRALSILQMAPWLKLDLVPGHRELKRGLTQWSVNLCICVSIANRLPFSPSSLPEWHVTGASSLELLEIIKTKTSWVEEKGPVFQERVPFNPFLCNRTIFHNSAKRFRVRTCDFTWAGLGFYQLILQTEMEITKLIGIKMIMQTLDIVEFTAGQHRITGRNNSQGTLNTYLTPKCFNFPHPASHRILNSLHIHV